MPQDDKSEQYKHIISLYRALRTKYNIRDTITPDERKFFLLNHKTIPGYYAEDGQVVINPFYKGANNPLAKMTIFVNEASRMEMDKIFNNKNIDMDIRPHQEEFFKGSSYSQDKEATKKTILARILSGDPSAGEYSDRQFFVADSVRNIILGK